MKEKLLWASIVVLGLALVASRAQSPSTPPLAPRFQMFAAERETGRSSSKGPVVFRLDTQTGEVATYQEGFLLASETLDKKPYRFSFWRKVDEQPTMIDAIEEAKQDKRR
jgi:hypothetical protein